MKNTSSFAPHPNTQRTLVIIKPDGIQRSLIGEIIQRYERTGLKLCAIKMLVPTAEFVEKHYTLDPEWLRLVGEKTNKSAAAKGHTPIHPDPVEAGRIILGTLKRYFTGGPVIAMVWQGMNAVEIVRKITGSTEPLTSIPGTIRGDYVLDSYKISGDENRAIRNLVHASGSTIEAEAEIKLWFKPAEVIDYALVSEKIIYDVNLDGIME